MSDQKINAIAEAGFREIADRAVVLRDQLRAAGAPQSLITRADRIQFAAAVGQNEAETAAQNAEPENLALA